MVGLKRGLEGTNEGRRRPLPTSWGCIIDCFCVYWASVAQLIRPPPSIGRDSRGRALRVAVSKHPGQLVLGNILASWF